MDAREIWEIDRWYTVVDEIVIEFLDALNRRILRTKNVIATNAI